MHFKEAESLVRARMTEHQLTEWRFRWGRGKRRCGSCRYRDKVISLSTYHVKLNTPEQVLDTVLHEIAHALAGPGTHHGPAWKAMCIKIGAKPERLAGEEVQMYQNYNHYYKCSLCGYLFKRYKRVSNLDRRYHIKCGRAGKLLKINELEGIK